MAQSLSNLGGSVDLSIRGIRGVRGSLLTTETCNFAKIHKLIIEREEEKRKDCGETRWIFDEQSFGSVNRISHIQQVFPGCFVLWGWMGGCICPDSNVLWRFPVRKEGECQWIRCEENLSCTVLGVLHGLRIWGTPLGCAILFLGSSLRKGTLPVRWRRILSRTRRWVHDKVWLSWL